MDQTLPSWATQLRNRYLSGESSVFLLHGNVRDVQPWMEPDGKVVYLALRDFLTRFLGRSKEPVVHYNVSEGLEFGAKGQAALFKKAINLRRTAEGRALVEDLPFSPGLVLPILEDLITDPTQRAGVVVDYLEMIAPNGDLSFLSEPDKANLVTLQRLGGDPGLLHSDNLVIFVTEVLGDISRRLTSSPHISALEIPRPDQDTRSVFLKHQDLMDIRLELTAEQLSKITAGLTLLQVQSVLRQARQSGEALTFAMVNRRKKAIIEQECHGLVEFVDPKHGFAEVGGMDAIKTDLNRLADAIKSGQRARVPMGLIFVGPMGTGKTFVAEAFAKESGLTCLKFKNFREKWVGSTESNLEKVLQLVDGLGYALVIIDEADRSLASGETDGGTSSRVIARLKEFMSDTSHRGRVVMLMMTNRPDKLDVDLKRPGRFDVKIPFFFAQTAEERKQILEAVFRRGKILLAPGLSVDAASVATAGWSAAELESLALTAANYAAWDGREQVSQPDMDRALADVIPSRDTRMLEYMEMLAVFESSSRRYLPEHYQGLQTHQVQDQLDLLRVRLGSRVS
ncbi:MAG TPA: ATP-binding protein [Myxococcota bacterium]|nr:ATP-binding protein [Myxococcota bacterium]